MIEEAKKLIKSGVITVSAISNSRNFIIRKNNKIIGEKELKMYGFTNLKEFLIWYSDEFLK